MTNTLYYGDNLEVLRKYIADQSVDLVYLDPPFNSNRSYNVLFGGGDAKAESKAQIRAFEDTWHWGEAAVAAFDDIIQSGRVNKPTINLLRALIGDPDEAEGPVGKSDLAAYLVMMTARLAELHRVLKPTGSLYLHCDPTASHYLKLILDNVFGPDNFQNEIIWHYRKWPSGKYSFQRNHDVIFFYSRSGSNQRTFNQLYMERAASTLKRFGKAKIVSGHDETGRRIPSQTEEQESEGVRQDDVWDIGRVPPVKQLYPTQKPLTLLERIISASSNPGDVVLDPFCGCGTTIEAAEKLGRQWIGIDITSLAIGVITDRIKKSNPNFQIIGWPKDTVSAAMMAHANALQGRYDFQDWAVWMLDGLPNRPASAGKSKMGADGGYDGYITFYDSNGYRDVLISVKSGKLKPDDVRALGNVVQRKGAAIGVLLTLEPPSKEMLKEAQQAPRYYSETWNRYYPGLQIITVDQLFAGVRVDMPPHSKAQMTRQAQPIERTPGEQMPLIGS